MKQDLLTNATVVNDAIRFVSDHEKTTKKSDNIASATAVGVDTEDKEKEVTTSKLHQHLQQIRFSKAE